MEDVELPLGVRETVALHEDFPNDLEEITLEHVVSYLKIWGLYNSAFTPEQASYGVFLDLE